MSENKSELYTFEEARAMLRTSKQKNGWLIPKSAIDDFIESQLDI